MRNLAEDRDEVSGAAERRWVQRARNVRGIRADEPTTWFADHCMDRIAGAEANDREMVAIGRSPGDVLLSAQMWAEARFAARRDGVGRWTMEVMGDGENSNPYLIVYPVLDEEAPE